MIQDNVKRIQLMSLLIHVYKHTKSQEYACYLSFFTLKICVVRKNIGWDYVRAIVQINADVLFAYYFDFRKSFVNQYELV